MILMARSKVLNKTDLLFYFCLNGGDIFVEVASGPRGYMSAVKGVKVVFGKEIVAGQLKRGSHFVV